MSNAPGKKFKLVFAMWWLSWSVVHYSVLLNFGLTSLQAFTDSIISNTLLAGCCLLIINNMRYYVPRQEKYWYVLAISFGLACVWTITVRIILWSIFRKQPVYISVLNGSTAVRYGMAFLMLGCMASMCLLWFTQKEQKEMDARKTEAENLAKEAELYKLRQQLQPHFLFNSLNSISALVTTQPEQARKMVHQLSDFLRGTLKKEEHLLVNLEEELEYLELYLDIEKVRFGHRLSTIVTCEDACKQMKLPPLLLQPVVENAIKFGLYDTTDDVTISIDAKKEKDQLVITVINPFDPQTSNPRQGVGFGLTSVQRRLYLLFALNNLLQTKAADNLFITTVKIPQPLTSTVA